MFIYFLLWVGDRAGIAPGLVDVELLELIVAGSPVFGPGDADAHQHIQVASPDIVYSSAACPRRTADPAGHARIG